MEAVLVRVGIDQTYGHWNGPIDPDSRQFVYVPIPESQRQHKDCSRGYDELLPVLEQFASDRSLDIYRDLRFPQGLCANRMHLDPDFYHLTYGDDGNRRGSDLRKLAKDDLVVFYAGLRPTQPGEDPLCYALIGLLVVDEVVEARSVSKRLRHENAHTRRMKCDEGDIIVRGQPAKSGRFDRCIPIGEFRDGAYRATREFLEACGGLAVKDGFLQRSGRPPRFLHAEKFCKWFLTQGMCLTPENNPTQRVAIVVLRRHCLNAARPDA